MDQLKNLFAGYRTYICAGVLFVAGGLMAMKYISQEQYNAVVALFGPAGLFFLRKSVQDYK